MSVLRAARLDELPRLWPAIRAARLLPSLEALERFHAEGDWRLRVSDAGEGLMLERWRADLDVLAIKGVWAAEHRIGDVLREAAAVGRQHGFGSLLSPLLTLSALVPYFAAGMAELQRIVALQAHVDDVAGLTAESDLQLRAATAADIGPLVELDATCFDSFWHYGPAELEAALAAGELFIAEKGGVLLGYDTVTHHGASSVVGRLAVSPAFRRRGAGKALLVNAARQARGAGAFGLTLCTQEDNEASRALYASVGFVEVAERYALALQTL